MTAPRGVEVWRDFVTDGIPSSGPNHPYKADIRAWAGWLENLVTSGVLSSGPWFATKAAMTLTYPANTIAIVYNDTTAANNGLYRKSGGSGAGSWIQLTTFLPGYQFVTASPTGASTANAIVATTSPRLPEGDGVALITLPIPQTNTGSTVTVKFDGGVAKTIISASGAPMKAGDLRAGVMVAGFVSGSNFRLLNDIGSHFITATNTGGVNAITATTPYPIPAGDGEALIVLPISADNTASPVTVKFNAGAVLTIKTRSGEDPAIGELQAGDILSGFVSGSTFRLMVDPNSLLHMQAAKEWANNAEDVPVSVVSGGDGSTTFSARHWAAKSYEQADRAEDDADRAEVAQIGAEDARDMAASIVNDIASEKEVPIVGTVESLTLLDLPVGMTAVRTNGYSAIGDGGAWPLVVEVAEDGSPLLPWQRLSNGGTRRWILRADTVTPDMFGARNDGVTPDDDAFDRAYDWCMAQPNGGTIVMLAGAGYYLTAPHNIHPNKHLRLHWNNGASLICGLVGADAVLLEATHPDGETRGKNLTLSGNSSIVISPSMPGNAIGAKFFEYRRASNLKIEGDAHSWLHYRNNTVVSLSSLWNCDMGGLSIWGGGHNKPRKLAGTTTFSIAQGSNTLIASAPIFDASDEDRIIVLTNSGGRTHLFTIDEVTSSTTVTTKQQAVFPIVDGPANFDGVKGSISASSSLLTLESGASLSSADVGRTIYIVDAANPGGGGSPRELHRATIDEVTSATTCVIDTAPLLTVSDVYVIFSPAIEIFSESVGANAGTNDFVWDGLHIEQHRGCGLVLHKAVNAFMPRLKLHAQNNVYGVGASSFRGIFSSATGHVSGDFEGTAHNDLGAVLVAGTNGMITFDQMTGVQMLGQPLIYKSNLVAGSLVIVGNWQLNNFGHAPSMDRAFAGTGSGEIHQTGRLASTGVNYPYPYLFSESRLASSLISPQIKAAISAEGMSPAFALIANGDTPAYRGIGVSGSLLDPGPSGDYQSLVALEGYGLASGSSSPEPVARVLARARVSGSNLGGDLVFITKGLAQPLSAKWSMGGNGNILPSGDAMYDIGDPSYRVNRLYTVNLTSGPGGLGFFGAAMHSKPAVSGAKGGNAALTSLIQALTNLGLITDESS
ncbi:UbiD family decarboxylase [Shinella daejeonensis]|uniref:UbiD family decarboxylase n=1 Tax=Shinella daejeonensis TaxID=659017 RepID=UPI0020C7E2A4|nr:UbiD family decarboxylase [Shinella daejeonensis]MCP8895357.1 UbiD family decarboxylase [Shinella daejeonensis]